MPFALIATLLVFVALVVVGVLHVRAAPQRKTTALLWMMLFGLLLSVPALLFAGYYLHLVDEPVLLYRLRALPGSELLAGLIGLPTGWIAAKLAGHAQRSVRLTSIALALAPMLILLPYAKELLSPLDRTIIRERWSDGVCLQSTASTCGPSSAATLLRHFGLQESEEQLAVEAHTTASGTEIWYLARTLRARGLSLSFVATAPNPTTLLYPAIAGTRLGNQDGTGHFITVLGREGDHYVIGDPMGGRSLLPVEGIGQQRFFTGFFLVAERN